MTICETFRNTAIETWGRLSDAKDYKLSLGEETITDINLLEIAKARHPEIKIIIKFTRIAESKNGADWEWWLTGKSGKWLGLRIQAKVINTENEKYEYLHYDKGKQTEKLINKSMKNKDLIPLYCLYTMCDLSQYEDKFACIYYFGRHDVFGCSFVDAFVVKNLGDKKHISHLIQDMIPWHCIFCPFIRQTGDLPERALLIINRTLQQILQPNGVEVDEYIKNFTLPDTPPAYVSNLLKHENSINGIEAPDNDLAGIVVIDEKRKNNDLR